ncbi:DTW domain-containing protein 1 [Mortierella sp. NVP85]|nr:DTW domain-containing protein 1 [Mortierella sp. NVP85]
MTSDSEGSNNTQHDSMDSKDSSNKRYKSPFSQFDITSTNVLDTIEKKHCPKCNKNVRYFCNKCLHLVNCPEGSVPQLKLPIKIDIIKHEGERDGKSTALHAKILAPDDVDVYGWKSMPEYENVDRLLLLFPCPEAKRLCEIDPASFDKLVVIDGTWDQVKMMTKSSSPLVRMKRVTIAPHETLFWRHQRKTDDHLATIEAIYYFLREYHETYLSTLPEPVGAPPQPPVAVTTTSTTTDPTQAEQANRPDEERTSIEPRDVDSSVSGHDTPDASKTKADVVPKAITPHKEWIDSRKLGPYTNQYDDMLWFYKYFYELIQKSYRERADGKEFTLRHKKGYIRHHTKDDNQITTGVTSTPSPSTVAAAVTATTSEEATRPETSP